MGINFPNTKEEIIKACKIYNIDVYNIEIDEDMSVNINRDVKIINKNLNKLPLNFNIINGDFSCAYNRLTSLELCPNKVSGFFTCSYNNLDSLEGMPSIIPGNIYCHFNRIKSFKGVPENFEGRFVCDYNPIEEVYKLFRNNSKCIYWINEYDVIQGDNIIINRLEEVFYQLEMEVPYIKEIKGYNLI